MKRQKGFTLIEALVAVAILGVIFAVIALNIGNFSGRESPSNEVPAYNVTQMDELSSEPLSSLSIGELQLLADYCMWSSDQGYSYESKARWVTRAAVYQNQIIIQLLLSETKEVQ